MSFIFADPVFLFETVCVVYLHMIGTYHIVSTIVISFTSRITRMVLKIAPFTGGIILITDSICQVTGSI